MEPNLSKAALFRARVAPPERRWLRDPVSWAKDRAGIDLWSKQRQIIEAVRDNQRVAVHSSHEIGKSFLAAVTVCWWLDTHLPGEAFVVTTAPTAPQVKAILWTEINSIHERAGLRGRTNLTEWYEGNKLVAFGRKPSDYNDSAFQGIHARYVLVVLDEACGIPQTLWTAASTIAANQHSRILAIGNPDDPSSEFARVCAVNSGWETLGIGYQDTPNFTGEPVSPLVADSLIHPSWVEDRRNYWGEDSALFQSKCLGIFPTVGDPWQVVPLAWADQCRYKEFPAGLSPIEAGIDIGAGNDRTVVVVREGQRIKTAKWFVSADPMQSVALIAEFLREHKVTTAKVDSIGVGWGVYGRLRELSAFNNPTSAFATHHADIVPINVAEKPTMGNEHLYLNKRAEMWWTIGREFSRAGRWDFGGLERRFMDDMIHELTMPKYEIVDSHGKVKIEPKEKIRERLRASPDLAEAALLAFTPASWAADMTTATGIISAPSLFTDFSPTDMLNSRGW